MSRYKEYYNNMSIGMKSWKSTLNSLDKKIKRSEHKLNPYLEGHFENRIYINSVQVKINDLNKLKKEYEILKNNRPEPKKSTARKTTNIKIKKTYDEKELKKRFNKLPNVNKINILLNTLNDFKIDVDHNIFIRMGYFKKNDKWEKS